MRMAIRSRPLDGAEKALARQVGAGGAPGAAALELRARAVPKAVVDSRDEAARAGVLAVLPLPSPGA